MLVHSPNSLRAAGSSAESAGWARGEGGRDGRLQTLWAPHRASRMPGDSGQVSSFPRGELGGTLPAKGRRARGPSQALVPWWGQHPKPPQDLPLCRPPGLIKLANAIAI